MNLLQHAWQAACCVAQSIRIVIDGDWFFVVPVQVVLVLDRQVQSPLHTHVIVITTTGFAAIIPLGSDPITGLLNTYR